MDLEKNLTKDVKSNKILKRTVLITRGGKEIEKKLILVYEYLYAKKN